MLQRLGCSGIPAMLSLGRAGEVGSPGDPGEAPTLGEKVMPGSIRLRKNSGCGLGPASLAVQKVVHREKCPL